jgi:hypothetical protein
MRCQKKKKGLRKGTSEGAEGTTELTVRGEQ